MIAKCFWVICWDSLCFQSISLWVDKKQKCVYVKICAQYVVKYNCQTYYACGIQTEFHTYAASELSRTTLTSASRKNNSRFATHSILPLVSSTPYRLHTLSFSYSLLSLSVFFFFFDNTQLCFKYFKCWPLFSIFPHSDEQRYDFWLNVHMHSMHSCSVVPASLHCMAQMGV